MNATHPAFPTAPELGLNAREGMDLRTYIATACLAGMLSNPAIVEGMAELIAAAGADPVKLRAELRDKAISHADELIRQLNSNA